MKTDSTRKAWLASAPIRWVSTEQGKAMPLDVAPVEAVVTRAETVLGTALRAARMGHGFGLRELARRVGISATYLSRIETGEERRPPSEEALTALARDLAADPDELLALAGRVPADVIDILLADRTLWATLRQVAHVGMTGDLMRARLGLPEDDL